MTPEDALLQHFGMPSFRQPQRAIIDSVLAKQNTLVVMPTGGGKRLCFQLPALLLPGVTLVVSPLIALMKDQVDALQARGLPAGLLNNSQTLEEQRATLDAIRARTLKLVYVAPERFRSQSFLFHGRPRTWHIRTTRGHVSSLFRNAPPPRGVIELQSFT